MVDPREITEIPTVPDRPSQSHKGSFGTVIVVGGCPTMIGAPAICARAALRGGAGLVKIATSSRLLPHLIEIEPSATGIELEGTVDHHLAAMDLADPDETGVLAVGPGMGTQNRWGRLVMTLLRCRRSMVLDADGLNLLAAMGQRRPAGGPPLVLTPHPGEFRRLAEPIGIPSDPTDPSQRRAAAIQLATAHHATVVLKGNQTVVTNGKQLFLNQSGNPALATAGTGDVLTGLIASLIAQGLTVFDASVLAVHAHGLAADYWARAHGPAGLLARELADRLPDALNKLRQERGKRWKGPWAEKPS